MLRWAKSHMIRLRGYVLTLLNIRFMQPFTQPSIADTWVVTHSSFIEWFAGACVYCSLQVIVLLWCWILTIVGVMHNYTRGWNEVVWLGSPLQPYTTLQLLLPRLVDRFMFYRIYLFLYFYFFPWHLFTKTIGCIFLYSVNKIHPLDLLHQECIVTVAYTWNHRQVTICTSAPLVNPLLTY